MAAIIQEAASAGQEESNAVVTVKHLKNDEVMSLKKMICKKLERTVLSPEPADIMERTVTNWEAVRKWRFKKYVRCASLGLKYSSTD